MKMLFFILILFAKVESTTEEIALATLRNLYYEANFNKTAVTKLHHLLGNVNENSAPILLCYKGAAQMMEAKYAFNPITKFSRFNKGKNNIERAIAKQPKQIEIRFIRFTIQTNLPPFLGYNQFIDTDKTILLNAIPNLEDNKLKENVVNYLLSSKHCTNEEIKKLRSWQNK